MHCRKMWLLLFFCSILVSAVSLQALPYIIVYLGNGALHEGSFALRVEDDLRRELALVPKTLLSAPEDCARTAAAVDFSRDPQMSQQLLKYCESHFPESTLVVFTDASPAQFQVARRLFAFSSQTAHATLRLNVLSMLEKKITLSTDIPVTVAVDGPYIGLTFPSDLRVPAIEQSQLVTMLSREASLRAAHFIELIARASDPADLAHLRANTREDTATKKAAPVDSAKSRKK